MGVGSDPSADAIDERNFGTRNQRGEWTPNATHHYPPLFDWPPSPRAAALWFLRGYVLSWNLFYALVAVGFWAFLSPSTETSRELEWPWITGVLARNTIAVLAFYGVMHFRLYVGRAQETSFKFNGRWPRTNSAVFLFGDQTRDNIFWTLLSGVPIWTAVECLMLWAHANGYVTPLVPNESPVLFVLLMLAVPAFRDLHFYATHRLLHVGPLYRWFHKLHHNNTNPGPWSGLAMHPVEHVLYFTGVLIHFVISAHPIHIIFQLVHAGLAPAPGHAGFAKVVIGGHLTVDTNAYNHYLHHKYFECNYADGPFPLDRWFGTYHDGSPHSREALKVRLAPRRTG